MWSWDICADTVSISAASSNDGRIIYWVLDIWHSPLLLHLSQLHLTHTPLMLFPLFLAPATFTPHPNRTARRSAPSAATHSMSRPSSTRPTRPRPTTMVCPSPSATAATSSTSTASSAGCERRSVCPLCNKEWDFAKIERIPGYGQLGI